MARNWFTTEVHCNHQVDFTARSQDSDSFILSKPQGIPEYHTLHTTTVDYHQLAQHHLKLAVIMRNHNQLTTCLILCDWALISMVKALYIHRYQTVHPLKELTMNEILPLVHTDTESGLDIALFIGTMQHMSSLEECPQNQSLKPSNIEKLLQRTEEIIEELNNRLKYDPPDLR
ncbi:hypothetical protein [Paenibacillus xylanexedens]|uniref:hypothetical protein n=1 Tax=Paenibacillus xylanexedens TaxID=528191 RepID=UPI0011A28224|nr:hypothetical protein [Paenibacillus xylanexedens]